MIHEIAPHTFGNRYQHLQEVGDDDYVLCFQGRSLLVKIANDGPEVPRKRDLRGIPEDAERTFLFTLNSVPCFLVIGTIEADASQQYREINVFRDMRPELGWISMAGFHLMTWYTQNRFCGACGAKTTHKPDERALVCPQCHATIFPRISPAVIVAITCNDKILLARSANPPRPFFSLLAGYVEVGEAIENTLQREVKEEVGLDIWNIRYYKSQPWPLSGSLMLGFTAEADEHQPLCIDPKELAEAAWFSRDNLPEHYPNISIAGELIAKFAAGE